MDEQNKPAAELPTLPGFIRKKIEQAIDAAKKPQGMGVHDGMVRLHASHVERLLMAHDAAIAAIATKENAPERK